MERIFVMSVPPMRMTKSERVEREKEKKEQQQQRNIFQKSLRVANVMTERKWSRHPLNEVVAGCSRYDKIIIAS